MSLSNVFSSFYTSSSSSQTSYVEYAQAKPTEEDRAKPMSDVYVASESYRFEARYSVYSDSSSSMSTESKAADTILNFIGQRVKMDAAEGATAEELESRLSAGLEGFVAGYTQAYEQLAELSFLNPYVESAIETTYSSVISGIDALAEELNIESPVDDDVQQVQTSRRDAYANANEGQDSPDVASLDSDANNAPQYAGVEQKADAAATQNLGQIVSDVKNKGAINAEAQNLRSLISASSYDYRASESRSFDFSLTTQDGDMVTIRAAYDNVSILNGQTVDYGEASASEVNGSFKAASGFYLDVRGDLDEDEYKAIEDLLSQVKQVSDMFFSGDLESAFEYATEMGFNEMEIAEFSLRLRYQVAVVVEETYQQMMPTPAEFDKFDAKDQRLMIISQFIQALEDLRSKAEELGISGFSAKEAVDAVSTPEEKQSSKYGLVQNYLASLESLKHDNSTE